MHFRPCGKRSAYGWVTGERGPSCEIDRPGTFRAGAVSGNDRTPEAGELKNATPEFTDEAWNSHIYWRTQDRKTLKRINDLFKDAQGEAFAGIGKPEALKHSLSGCWSRRIDETNRLVYMILDEELVILSCRYHY